LLRLRISTVFLIGAASLVFAPGCGDDDGGTSDAAPDGTLDATADAARDAELLPSDLFGECEVDSQCPGPNAVCRTRTDGWPGGFCTRRCPGGDRGPCEYFGAFHSCMDIEEEGEFECEANCLNSLDCRPGYICADQGAVNRSFGRDPAGRCVPICVNDDVCGEGGSCNRWTGRCYADTEPDPMGALNGEACPGGSSSCRSGNCLGPVGTFTSGDTFPTGWVDGYCFSNCALPEGYNTDTFWADGPLPQGACPAGDICFPAAGTLQSGDLGYCMPECTSDADCRAADGYFCRKSFTSSGPTPPNGVCWYITNCNSSGCPAGLDCVESRASAGSRPFYRCGRP